MWNLIDSDTGNIPCFRIKNKDGRYLVEFGHMPEIGIKLAVWSWIEGRGYPILKKEEALDIMLLLHHKDCELVESQIQLEIVDFW